MTGPFQSNLHARVVLAAEAALKRDGSVGPLHLLMEMRFLPASHFENWRQGRRDTLQRWIQVASLAPKIVNHVGRIKMTAVGQFLDVADGSIAFQFVDGVEPLSAVDQIGR